MLGFLVLITMCMCVGCKPVIVITVDWWNVIDWNYFHFFLFFLLQKSFQLFYLFNFIIGYLIFYLNVIDTVDWWNDFIGIISIFFYLFFTSKIFQLFYLFNFIISYLIYYLNVIAAIKYRWLMKRILLELFLIFKYFHIFFLI